MMMTVRTEKREEELRTALPVRVEREKREAALKVEKKKRES